MSARLIRYTLDGIKLTHDISFGVTDDDGFDVYINRAKLDKDLDYDVVGTVEELREGNGKITLKAAHAASDVLLILSDTLARRVTNFAQAARFEEAEIDNEFDNLLRLLEDATLYLTSTPYFNPVDIGLVDGQLPALIAGGVLRVNEHKNGFELVELDKVPEFLEALRKCTEEADRAESEAGKSEVSAREAQDIADSIGQYRGLWPNSGGSAKKGDTWQLQTGGSPSGQYYTALKDTTVSPVNDNENWRQEVNKESLSNYTDIVYKVTGGNSAVANMIADFAANPLMRAIGTIIKTGGTTWVYEDSTGAITEKNFRAFNVRNVVDYGATGDGVTNDTQSFVDARGDIASPRALYVPEPKVSYLVSNFQLGKECRIDGDGKYKSRIIGDNTNPIFLFGDGINGAYRDNEIYGLTLSNTGASCVVGAFSPNWIINNCTLRSTGGDGTFNTVSFGLSPRGNFSHNIGGIIGSGFALSFTDNCNGQVVHHNIWTGGTSGGAMKCGQSQVISFKWNIIESSLDGIYVASTSGIGEGICSAVEIENNYFEQCRNPIVLGTVFIVKGWSVKKNIVSNGDFNVVSSRDASYKFGRVFDGEFGENYTTVASNGTENFIDFVLNQNNDLQGNTFKKGRLENAPLALASYSGSLANDSSTRQNLGGHNYIDFLSLASTESFKEYYSPTFTGNVSTGTVAWINETILELGGKIFGIEVIEKQGDLTGASLQIGDNADPDRLVSLDLESPIYEFGYYDVPLTHPTNHIRKQNKNLIRNIAGTGSGTYRVLVKYRAI